MAKLPLENVSLAKQRAINRQPPVKELSSSLLCLGVMLGLILSDKMAGVQWVLIQILASIAIMIMPKSRRMNAAIVIIGLSIGIIATLCERYIFDKKLLEAPITTYLTGTIYHSETQASGRVRLWLSDLESDAVITQQDSAKIRIIISEGAPEIIQSGDQYKGRVKLFPISTALFPDWPNYGRKSWREGLVATGYSLSGRIHEQRTQEQSYIVQMRTNIHKEILEELTPHSATIASALLIGRKNYKHQIVFDHFRQAGLAHLLAISGLHMALFCVSLYGVMRLIMSQFVSISQRWSAHKIAAVLAIAAGFIYLLLAGHPISAIRAFFMTAFMFCAVLLDRRTVTLRHLNYVTFMVLVIMPSALYQPAFQLSFAATYGIVMFHDAMSIHKILSDHPVVRHLCYMVATSSIAILATLLITSYHFGVLSVWGVMANMVAIPFTALIVMPLGILFLVSIMGGFEGLIGPIFEVALKALLQFAAVIAQWPYSELHIKMPPAFYLPLSVILALCAYYAKQRQRLFVLIILSVMALHWFEKPRPIAAFHLTDYRIHAAYLDKGVLYHTRFLSNFWKQSYQKLFGKVEKTKRIQCNKGCYIPITSTDNLYLETSPQTDLRCPRGQGVMVTFSQHSCGDNHPYVTSPVRTVSLLYKRDNYYFDHAKP